jgi:hypothetical protein
VKRIWFLIATVVLVLSMFVLAPAVPLSVSAAGQQSFPESINGYPVIFVQTSENTCGLAADEVVLTLLDTSATTAEDSIAKLNLAEYLLDNPLPKGWSIEVYGGPGASIGEFERVHKENYEWQQKYGPIELGPAPSLGTENTTRSSYPTFAIFGNSDPSSQVITGQRAQWYAPKVGTSQNAYSAFLNNGVTNVGRYFLQSGQVYEDGTGQNVWGTGGSAHSFNVSYVKYHRYEFSVVYSVGLWSMWCEDYTAGVFDYHIDNNATGTKLIKDTGTSVFFENWNTNASWYMGFTNPLSAFNAIDYEGQWKDWDGGKIYIFDSDGHSASNGGKITGSLVDDGTAKWHLEKLLLKQ